jgi:hypothetical protein
VNWTGASIRNCRLSWPERGKPWSLLPEVCGPPVVSLGLSPAPGLWALEDSALCRRVAVVDRLRMSPFIFCKYNGDINTCRTSKAAHYCRTGRICSSVGTATGLWSGRPGFESEQKIFLFSNVFEPEREVSTPLHVVPT